MAMIPPETLELIRSRLDIVELVGECVQLTRAGRNMKGRCPFHQERTPSFIVSPERQTFHCFGCGEGGDIFSFVMKTENLSFVESAEKLAARVGVKLEPAQALSPDDKARLRMKEALEFAAEHYHALLMKDPAADAARKYVASRHLNKAAVEEFRLGYAPRQGHLVEAALKKGYAEDILLKAGLAAKRPDGSLRDYFFDRLMFPIRDAKGAVVGFGGRTLGDGEPKYLNSPESPVFSKGRVLYGLYEGAAAVRKSRRANFMEGYMDVIATHQHGLKSACAPLGTALTPEQAQLIKRYADSAVIVFDADNAGQNAAVRGAEVALAAGLGVRVATVPEGKDPDELLHAKGLEALQGALDAAVDLVAFKTELLVKRAGELTPEKKSAIAKDVMATIVACPDDVLKDEWVRRLAGRLGVNEDSLRRAGGKAVPQVRRAAAPAAAPARPAPAKPAELSASDLQLLGVLFKTPASAKDVPEDAFESGAARLILLNLRGVEPYDKGWGPRLLGALPPAESAVVSRLLTDELGYDDPAGVLRALLGKRARLKRLKELEPIVLSMGAGRPVDAGLRDEYQRLVVELKGTKR
ncbi:MAG: DNA primase [Elusimicrobia bacterium]|nr:DNA primase [Elusimicrobiota bacterium]